MLRALGCSIHYQGSGFAIGRSSSGPAIGTGRVPRTRTFKGNPGLARLGLNRARCRNQATQDHAGRVATSVRRNQWSSAEIYPKPSGASFTVNGEQVDMLDALASTRVAAVTETPPSPDLDGCIGTPACA
jgi:hypothetical protein